MRRCGACSREIPGKAWVVRALHDDALTQAEAVTACSLACVEAVLAENRREKPMTIPVRAKHVVMSNDQRRLMVLEGTPGQVVAVEGSQLRPMLRVVFTSAIDMDARPLTAHDRLELVVAPEELVLDGVGTDRAGVPDAVGAPAAVTATDHGQEARI